MEEVWRRIEGYGGYYEVSNLGRVRSLKDTKEGKLLTIQRHSSGSYGCVKFSVNGKKTYKYVYMLVATAFISNPYKFTKVGHKDGDKTNNLYTNLYWIEEKLNTNENKKTEKDKDRIKARKVVLARKMAMESIQEVWVNIERYKGLYQVSNLGRIRSLDNLKRTTKWIEASETDKYAIRIFTPYKGRIRKPQVNTKEYMRIKLSKNGKIENCSVATLVANAFVPNPYHSRAIRFKDGNKLNVSADNLYWYTGDKIVKIKVSNNTQVKKYVSIADAARQEHYAHETIRRYVNEHKPLDGFYYIKSEVI